MIECLPEIRFAEWEDSVTNPSSDGSKSDKQIKNEIEALLVCLNDEVTVPVLTQLADLSILRRRYADAESYLKQAVELEPDNTSLQLKLVALSITRTNYARAITSALQIIHTEFENPHAHYYLGVCFKQLKKLNKAEKALKMAVSLDPSLEAAHTTLASIYDDRLPGKRKRLGFLPRQAACL